MKPNEDSREKAHPKDIGVKNLVKREVGKAMAFN
jgi:hypothetical protein